MTRTRLMSFVRVFVPTVGTYASFLALVITLKPESGLSRGDWVLIAIGTLLAGFSLVMDFREKVLNQPQRFPSDRQIHRYMDKWIRHEGQVAIFSHDMTWARGDIVSLLYTKAADHELALFLPHETRLAIDLKKRGATVYCYPNLNYIPQSRFTVIRRGRSDAAVAIGRTQHGEHVIEEFSVGSHPAYSLCEDLLEILRRVSTQGASTCTP